jgi:PAS domain-containing protein
MALNLNEDINNSPFACEKGLDGSNNRYRVLFDAIGDGVFLYGFNEGQNPYTNFIEVNAAACKQSGYTRNELLKLSPFDLMTMPKGDDFQRGKRSTLMITNSSLRVPLLEKTVPRFRSKSIPIYFCLKAKELAWRL